MKREDILEQIENNNDEVGAKFNNILKEATARYEMGIIHHEEYFKVTQKALDRAKEGFISINGLTDGRD